MVTNHPDQLIETWEVGELELLLEADAMVSCTPYWGDQVVLPTIEVPYTDRMVWSWDIEQFCQVDQAVVVAKTLHRFSLHKAPFRPGDTMSFYLYSQDLDHAH